MSSSPSVSAPRSARFRQASADDLDAILRVEQSWHKQGRADAAKFLSRLARFPQGFLVGGLDENGAERIVATITSMPIAFDPDNTAGFTSWDAVTNGGYLFEHQRIEHCDALYIVSGIIEHAYRGAHTFEAGVMAQVELARALGLRYVVAGAVIPGYRQYLEKRGPLDAYRYCITRRGKHLIDPLLAMYEKIGFAVTDARHVIPDYFPDDASHNYAALVTRDLGCS